MYRSTTAMFFLRGVTSAIFCRRLLWSHHSSIALFYLSILLGHRQAPLRGQFLQDPFRRAFLSTQLDARRSIPFRSRRFLSTHVLGIQARSAVRRHIPVRFSPPVPFFPLFLEFSRCGLSAQVRFPVFIPVSPAPPVRVWQHWGGRWPPIRGLSGFLVPSTVHARPRSRVCSVSTTPSWVLFGS